jgi:hypothetical protein
MARPKSGRRAGRRPLDDFADYDLELTGWSWGFSFGPQTSKLKPHDFSTTRHIQLKGRVLTEVGARYPTASVTLIPDQVRTELSPREEELGRRTVGWFDAYGRELVGIFTLPEDSLATILSILAADKFRYFLARGGKLRYRSADIWRYSLETSVNPGDLLLGPGIRLSETD